MQKEKKADLLGRHSSVNVQIVNISHLCANWKDLPLLWTQPGIQTLQRSPVIGSQLYISSQDTKLALPIKTPYEYS